jgi:hypothetical protein
MSRTKTLAWCGAVRCLIPFRPRQPNSLCSEERYSSALNGISIKETRLPHAHIDETSPAPAIATAVGPTCQPAGPLSRRTLSILVTCGGSRIQDTHLGLIHSRAAFSSHNIYGYGCQIRRYVTLQSKFNEYMNLASLFSSSIYSIKHQIGWLGKKMHT